MGGVADYTFALCQALSEKITGQVRVWTKGDRENAEVVSPNFIVYRCAGDFGPQGLSDSIECSIIGSRLDAARSVCSPCLREERNEPRIQRVWYESERHIAGTTSE